ncbi:MAG: M24 family metallopeptidase [Bacteroidales bacterium]|nr:M24 family metallopeptidase [Bacteroidales bacterium]
MENLKLNSIREYMKEMAISAFIVPSNDPHFGEYIQNHFNTRAWLSGFTGSAGTLAITLKEAALWTDSRYFLQAEMQLYGSGIELKKLKAPGTESLEHWIMERLESNQSVGIDSSLFSLSEYNSLKLSFNNLNIQLCNDPFYSIWKDRPELFFNQIELLAEEFSGESTSSKHRKLISMLGVVPPFLYLVSNCDDVAWLCNIRGTDIPYNPLPLSYAAISCEKIFLFININSLKFQDKKVLESEGVVIMPYDSFTSFISEYPEKALRIAYPEKISIRNYNNAVKGGARFQLDQFRGGAISMLKAVKNPIEQEGFRKAMIYDGIAWIKTLAELEKRLQSGVNVYEKEVAELFYQNRSLNPNYKGESFSPIVATGANAALPHYSPSEEDVLIERKGFLLMDTGGHYLCGTTDTTRTISTGVITEEQKRDYTLILKGMISLSIARFIKGTRGSQLDILARGPISSVGKIYMHGTSHGIGHYLCVHEGPQSIRMEENPVTIEAGMVLSNEPAIYQEGKYGIRIENVLLCKQWKETNWGVFYEFETLTCVPIDTKPIIKELLCQSEIDWLNNYNRMVKDKLSSYLNREEQIWLSESCKKLD